MDNALEGVKVLDLTHVQAGPSCAQMLGFLGADVLKVEDTWGGDSTRRDLAHREDSDSFYFLIFNNNKRAMTLNLKTATGKEVLQAAFESGKTPSAIVEERGLRQVRDDDELDRVARQVIEANAKAVADYRGGKESAIQFLVGQVMRETRGRADPGDAAEMLRRHLDDS